MDEAGVNLGVMPRDAALTLAKEKQLDLIEIAPMVKPPVARIMSFDKFRYQKEKEFKKQRAGQKAQGLKQLRISARAQLNDLNVQAKKAIEFLEKGSKVEIMLWLRGREKGNRDWAQLKLREFLKLITIEHKLLNQPKFGGKGLLVQIEKK
mgnify:CR=1 FL=1